ncbi:endolytic transglycosylase MltG [Rhodococcus sp. 14C212]|uniref:endolytic transglycosylase MltG n=1 Tax=Rhodococcus sp. 14C212 TaxID=2711209 RepID=UPI0013ED7503|nr:endolytic transglycosylase MltG [Rhodococcus sp. 14C212]
MSRHGRSDDESTGADHDVPGERSGFGPAQQDEWYRPRHGSPGPEVPEPPAPAGAGYGYEPPPHPADGHPGHPFDDAPTTEHVYRLDDYTPGAPSQPGPRHDGQDLDPHGRQPSDGPGHETQVFEARTYETQGYEPRGYDPRDHDGYDPEPGAYRYDDQEQRPTYDESGYDQFGYAAVDDDPRGYAETPAAGQDWTDSADRAAPEPVGVSPARRAHARSAHARRTRGRIVGILAVAAVLVLLLGGGFFAYQKFTGPDLPPDYTGAGGPAVVVQVHPGDTAEQIGAAFKEADIVASSDAFYNAAVQNPGMNSLQPGFYSLASRLPAREAVAALVDPANRVGAVVISEGRQLHDIRDVNTGAVRKGIYTLIAEASCLDRDGQRTCLTYEELDAAGASTDLAGLGVPEWARGAVTNVPDRNRQLEGLIAAGRWDFDPSAGAAEILRYLVSTSAQRYDETGITQAAAKVGLTPYEMLVAASLVEREALPDDFAKVARVILNRLKIGQPLQFDSTVNYALDETELATTDADRAQVTPWNTYASPGLPATPISSPSIEALQAVENPEAGDWTYFVTIDAQGTTLFTNSYDEHLTNTQQALESGILDSGR